MKMELIGLFVDHLGVVLGILLGALFAIALVRSIIKASRGQKVTIPNIGVRNDLPDSITGRNRFGEDD